MQSHDVSTLTIFDCVLILNLSSCSCSFEFCYICGHTWEGYHGCPRYGPPIYDDEGYNQDGFHKDTGLDRAGLARQQEEIQQHLGNPDEEGDPDEEDEEDEDEDEVLDGLDMDGLEIEIRDFLLSLPPEVRLEVWEQARIHAAERGEIELGRDEEAEEAGGHDNNDGNPGSDPDDGGDGDDDQDGGEAPTVEDQNGINPEVPVGEAGEAAVNDSDQSQDNHVFMLVPGNDTPTP
jgi:hypothetical protein